LLRTPASVETTAPADQVALSAPAQAKVAPTLGKPSTPQARPAHRPVNAADVHLPIGDAPVAAADGAANTRPANAPPMAPAGIKRTEAPLPDAARPAAAIGTPARGLKMPEAVAAKTPAAEATPVVGIKKPEASLPTAAKPVAIVTAPSPGLKKAEVVAAKTPVAELNTAPPPAAAGAPRAPPDVARTAGTPTAKEVAAPRPEQHAAAPPDNSAQPYNELAFSVRKDLPAIKLSMHVYASDPSQRFVILNDSRMLEGDTQDDLSVREIRPDGVVFEFRGQRFFYPRDGL
jgi:general secretion pathway protein B